MSRYMLFVMVLIIGCAPGWDQKYSANDSLDTLSVLCSKWQLQRMWINESPLPFFHMESITTMELRKDNTFRTETQGIWFEGTWEFTGGGMKEIKLKTRSTNDSTTQYKDLLRIYEVAYLKPDSVMFTYHDADLKMDMQQLYIPFDEKTDTRSPGQRLQ